MSRRRKSTKRVAKSSRQSKKASKTTKRTARRQTPQSGTGRRIGTKRSDLRFEAPDGQIWASPFEYRVYDEIRTAGRVRVRKTTEADSIAYSTPVKRGYCAQCGSDHVAQARTYTPDLAVVSDDDGTARYFLETKGYFRGSGRNLLRAAVKANPQADIRLIAQSDHWVTKGKTRLSDWAKRFKIKFTVWNGALPEEWI